MGRGTRKLVITMGVSYLLVAVIARAFAMEELNSREMRWFDAALLIQPATLAVSLAYIYIISRKTRAARYRSGCCINCGYDLRGITGVAGQQSITTPASLL